MQTRFFYHASPNEMPSDPAELRLSVPTDNGWQTGEIPDVAMLCGALDEQSAAQWSTVIENEKGSQCNVYRFELPTTTSNQIRRLIALWHLAVKANQQGNSEGALKRAQEFCNAQREYGIEIQITRPDNGLIAGVSSWTIREVRFFRNPWEN